MDGYDLYVSQIEVKIDKGTKIEFPDSEVIIRQVGRR